MCLEITNKTSVISLRPYIDFWTSILSSMFKSSVFIQLPEVSASQPSLPSLFLIPRGECKRVVLGSLFHNILKPLSFIHQWELDLWDLLEQLYLHSLYMVYREVLEFRFRWGGEERWRKECTRRWWWSRCCQRTGKCQQIHSRDIWSYHCHCTSRLLYTILEHRGKQFKNKNMIVECAIKYKSRNFYTKSL